MRETQQQTPKQTKPPGRKGCPGLTPGWVDQPIKGMGGCRVFFNALPRAHLPGLPNLGPIPSQRVLPACIRRGFTSPPLPSGVLSSLRLSHRTISPAPHYTCTWLETGVLFSARHPSQDSFGLLGLQPLELYD